MPTPLFDIFKTMKTKKVRMNYTQLYGDSGRYIQCYGGMEYELPEKDANDFINSGAAIEVGNVIILNKDRGRPRKVKQNESGTKASDSSSNGTSKRIRRKKLSAN